MNLTSLLPELVKIYAPFHPSIQYDCEDAGQAVQVTADHASLSRAIGNLLSNAGRFAKQRVTVAALQQGKEMVIHVDDDGQGVQEEDRDKIFDPFVRLGGSSNGGSSNGGSSNGGSGLGLALVKRIVTRHHGRVAVSESPSGGARFSIFLPAD